MKFRKIEFGTPFFAVLAIIILILFIGPISTCQQKKFDVHKEHFDSTKIEGVLEYQKNANRGRTIKIEGIKKQLIFYVYDKGLQTFRVFAEKGDSIYKPAFADTLKLIKGDKVYKYTFGVPSNRKSPK